MNKKVKPTKYQLSKLLIILNKNAQNNTFKFGHFTSKEWADFCIKDLNNLKKLNLIDGKWKIIEDPESEMQKSVEISNYKKIGNLSKYRLREHFRELWIWSKLNYGIILSVTLFIILIIVLLMIGIWTHVFGY